MRGYAEVGEDGIHFFHSVIAEEVVQIAEIASYEGESFIVHNVTFRIRILVETVEVDALVALSEDFLRVPATAEGDIYIDASWLEIHSVDAFM
jgi:hypothetical protein